MKKLISLLLVIIITCSVLSGCVYFDRYLKIKKVYLDQFGIKDKNPEDVIIDYDGGTYNGARIVMLDAEWHDPEEWTEIIGETKLQYYDSNRLYAYKDGHFITLTQAFENSILKKSDVHHAHGVGLAVGDAMRQPHFHGRFFPELFHGYIPFFTLGPLGHWHSGMISRRLMFTWAGQFTIHQMVSAMSSGVTG